MEMLKNIRILCEHLKLHIYFLFSMFPEALQRLNVGFQVG